MNTINWDVGGTFTDCFLEWQDKRLEVKVPTATYDLSVGLFASLREATRILGITTDTLLENTDLIRYSTTVAVNSLIQRKGPRLGLIATEGFEDTTFVGNALQWADGLPTQYCRNLSAMQKPEPLIPRDYVVGIKERIDYQGRVIRPLDEEDALEKIDYLVSRGVRGFVVSLLWSFLNPAHEQRLKELIREEYPECFLGSLPVFISSEVHPKRFEYPRTNCTILNAYLHKALSMDVGAIRDRLRGAGYKKPIFLIHNSGGMADAVRTASLDTFNGGPVAGCVGTLTLGDSVGLKNIIFADMGGTSFDLSMVVDGRVRPQLGRTVIDRWYVNRPSIEARSIGAGGGSIAKINPLLGNQLEVGPESAGSMPGPVAYDQGGTEPTVTDADVVLGYIDADYFLGGKKILNREKAEQAIKEKIADPLGVSTEVAALLIRRVIDAKMGGEIYQQTVLRGLDPADFTLFAVGGAGPTHCADVASYAKVKRIVTFPFSSVFCAFASSLMATTHLYEQSHHVSILSAVTMEFFNDVQEFNGVVDELMNKAYRDFAGEGFRPEEVVFSLELDGKYGGQLNELHFVSPFLKLGSENDAKAVYEQFAKEYGRAYSPLSVYPAGGMEINNFVLRATVPPEKVHLPEYRFTTRDVAKALKSTRLVFWSDEEVSGGMWLTTNVYDMQFLSCGNTITGPSVIESEATTLLVPRGWQCVVDPHLFIVLTKVGE